MNSIQKKAKKNVAAAEIDDESEDEEDSEESASDDSDSDNSIDPEVAREKFTALRQQHQKNARNHCKTRSNRQKSER